MNFNFENFNSQRAEDLAMDVYSETDKGSYVNHDDGFMHVCYNGQRYAFDIGQDISSSQYNKEANRILGEIGIVGNVSGNNN